MRRNVKGTQEESRVITYVRLEPEDHEELKRREGQTGAPVSAQIRILVHEALRKGKAVIR